MGKKKPVKKYYRKQVNILKLIQKINLWPSRRGVLHGIKSITELGGYVRLITHCNKIILIRDSGNSRAGRWLRNKWYFKTCNECRIPDWKLEKYSTTQFSRRRGTQLK
jgi:pyrrolysyl-tRNA synthetase-like protein